jgi:hypothetical protein
MARDGELVLVFDQGVTVPGRHRQPPLGIEIERRNTLKHLDQSQKDTFHHLIALSPTVAANRCRATARLHIFSMKSTT